MGGGKINDAARAIASILDASRIPYAIVGALGLNAHGYARFTEDVDLLLTKEGLAQLKASVLGRGYAEKFPGSRGLRDTVNNVPIDVILTGDFPGDGKPKSVVFPEPSAVCIRTELGNVIRLETLLELKIASGLSAPHRLRDLSDALELIKVNRLDESYAQLLDLSVRDKFAELWHASQTHDDE